MYFARSADPAFGAVSGLDAATMIALFAERGGDPGRPGKKDPLDPLVWLAARPGEPAWPSEFRPRPARLARGVRRDRDRVPGRHVRRPGRRHRPGLPASRDERLARPGRARRPGQPGRAGVRPPVRARRAWCGWAGRRCPSPGQPGVRVRSCWPRASTRWRSGSRSSRTTTARTGTGPTPGWRPRRRGSTGGGRPAAAASGRRGGRGRGWPGRGGRAAAAGPVAGVLAAGPGAARLIGLDAPGAALAVIDAAGGRRDLRPRDPRTPGLVGDTIDALLGVRLEPGWPG